MIFRIGGPNNRSPNDYFSKLYSTLGRLRVYFNRYSSKSTECLLEYYKSYGEI